MMISCTICRVSVLEGAVRSGRSGGYPATSLGSLALEAAASLLTVAAALLTKTGAGNLAKAAHIVLAEAASVTLVETASVSLIEIPAAALIEVASVALVGASWRILSLALIRDCSLESAVSLHCIGNNLNPAVRQVDPVLPRSHNTVRFFLVVEVVTVVGLPYGPVECVRHPLAVK